MAPSPTSTRTMPARGRGQRGRPRLKGRGNPLLATDRRRPDASSPRRAAADGAPSGRRKPVYQNGYRPGGAGGGGRYIHPETGETIPAHVWKTLYGRPQRRRQLRDEGVHQPPNTPGVGPAGSSSARATPTLVPPTPLPAIHMPPPSDGVHKPREERSYTEFHPMFNLDQILPVFSAQEVDGENYKPPVVPETKTVKIIDVKEEEDLKRNEVAGGGRMAAMGFEQGMTVDSPRPIATFDASAAATPGDDKAVFLPNGTALSSTHGAIPDVLNGDANDAGGLPMPMEDVRMQSLLETPGGGSINPALIFNLTSPHTSTSTASSSLLPIDPALAQVPHSRPQTHTPAITPTNASGENATEKAPGLISAAFIVPPETTRRASSRQIDDTPTLASRRAHRSNAGSKPRFVPPTTGRKPRSQKEQSGWEEEKLNLPKPSYREIKPYQFSEVAWSQSVGSTGPRGINNPTSIISERMKQLGYQHTSFYSRPKTLLRDRPDTGIDEELGSADMTDIVEYDMDEQDDKWLTMINSHRIVHGLGAVTPEIFEITMTKIEKEWVALEKKMPKVVAKPHGASLSRRRSSGRAGEDDDDDEEGSEDSKCAICDDGECENSNAIVFCDGCNLAVHQECYGVPYIPEGQWLCRKCLISPRQITHCVFCPNTDGAFKQTTTNRWAHLLCAIWIPEVRLANPAYMEPVDGIEMVPKSRWKLSCYICKQKMGACIQCSNKSCYLAFHVTCGRRARLHMKMKNTSGPGAQLESSGLKAYCDKHVPADWRRENYTDEAILDAMDFYRTTMAGREWGDSQAAAMAFPSTPPEEDELETADGFSARINLAMGHKRKRVQQPNSVWKLPSGAPVIPRILFNSIIGSISQFKFMNVEQYVADACKYWTLKREARRGASLLKRLQLQMDSFTSVEVTRKNYASMGRTRGGSQLEHRREFASLLEKDLKELIGVVSEVKERESEKVAGAERFRDETDRIFFPEVALIRETLDKAQSLDTNNVFELGYGCIRDRLEHRLYPSVAAFYTDLCSVLRSPSMQPQLDFDINISGYVPPPLYRTTLATSKNGDYKKIGETILHAIRPSLEEVKAREAEHPTEKERLSSEMALHDKMNNSLTGASGNVTPYGSGRGTNNRPHSPSAQLVQEASPQKPKRSQRTFSPPAAPETVLGVLAGTVNRAMLMGLWDRDIDLGVVKNFNPPRLLASTKAPSSLAPEPASNYTKGPITSTSDQTTTVPEAKLSDFSRNAPLTPKPDTSPPAGDQPLTGGPQHSTHPSSPIQEPATQELVPDSVANVLSALSEETPEDMDEDMEDAPGEIIDEEEEALSIARATSTMPTTPAATNTPAAAATPAPIPAMESVLEKRMEDPAEEPTKEWMHEQPRELIEKTMEQPAQEPVSEPVPESIRYGGEDESMEGPTRDSAAEPDSEPSTTVPPAVESSADVELHDQDADGEPDDNDDTFAPASTPIPASTPAPALSPVPALVSAPAPAPAPTAISESLSQFELLSSLSVHPHPPSIRERLLKPRLNMDHARYSELDRYNPTGGDRGEDLLAGYRLEDLPSPMEYANRSPGLDDDESAHSLELDLPASNTIGSSDIISPENDPNNYESMTNTSVLSDPPSSQESVDIEQRLRSESRKGSVATSAAQSTTKETASTTESATPKSGGRGSRKGMVFPRQSNGRFGKPGGASASKRKYRSRR